MTYVLCSGARCSGKLSRDYTGVVLDGPRQRIEGNKEVFPGLQVHWLLCPLGCFYVIFWSAVEREAAFLWLSIVRLVPGLLSFTAGICCGLGYLCQSWVGDSPS